QGLPSANMGRIGLDWSRKNPNLVVAVIDTDKAGTGLPPAKGYLGVSVENSPQGVRITDLGENSPAVKAKLAKGDLLLSVNGKDFKTVAEYVTITQPLQPGDKLKLGYQRAD